MEVISSAIAQLVEQVTVNHWVPGSSPGRGARQGSREGFQNLWNPRKTRLLAGFFVLAFRRIPSETGGYQPF